MIEISETWSGVTVIEVSQAMEGKQDEAVARLRTVNDRIAGEVGWVSAAIHRSLDGSRVALYAQWRSHADLRAAISAEDLKPLLASLVEVAKPDWHLMRYLR